MSFFSRLWRGARPYRYETEQLNHAEQLQETLTSIDAMSKIPDDATGEEAYWKAHHRVGAQDRLAILLKEPRPTVEQILERDRIQGFLGNTEAPAPIRRFAMPIAGPWALLGNPLVWGAGIFAATFGWGSIEHIRANHEHALAVRATDTAKHNADVAVVLGQRLDAAKAQIAHDQTLLTGATDTIEHERAIAANAARRERERQREVQSVLSGGPPPAWGLQPSEPTASGGNSGQSNAANHDFE